MDGIAVKPLTVDFHEGGFQSKLNQENGLGFWFQLSDKQRQQAGSPWGPANAQALNRYSYVQNNPLKWTDPSGHTWYLNRYEAAQLASSLREVAKDLSGYGTNLDWASITVDGAGASVATYVANYPLSEIMLGGVGRILGPVGLAVTSAGFAVDHVVDQINELATLIEKANIGDQDGSKGVILELNNGVLSATDRQTGSEFTLKVPFWMEWNLPKDLRPGTKRTSETTTYLPSLNY